MRSSVLFYNLLRVCFLLYLYKVTKHLFSWQLPFTIIVFIYKVSRDGCVLEHPVVEDGQPGASQGVVGLGEQCCVCRQFSLLRERRDGY